ncbi:MAG TPA: glycosyltransferase family 4 protein [Burkholderiales bacterium]|nr:glycosyltransferase family 4 protein [Burkholderiales bacterium]
MLRLALVRQRYSPYGGAERFIARALPALERAGAEVTLISRSGEGWGARRLLRVDPFHVGNLWRDWSFARAARTAWRRESFDIVQSHERIPGCDVYRAGDGVHRRWLELRQRTASVLERIGIALNPYHRYVCSAERQMFEHPRLRAVICNSRMVRDEVQRAFRIGREKLHVIYNGVDLEYFHPRQGEALRGAARAQLGCRPRDTLFLFVGSGFSRKGLAAAIDALAAAANPAFWLLVVGRDREQARFAAQARAAGLSERARFLGGRDDVRPLYAAADCFILPSRYDPFPNTALEALAMGLPAIVSSRCGAAEIVEPGANGWVCEPDNAPGIARLMQAADGAIRDGRMARAARSTAERFGIEAMAGKLAELYVSIDERR